MRLVIALALLCFAAYIAYARGQGAQDRKWIDSLRDERPWDHPYDTEFDGLTCLHCGYQGSYAHTQEFYEKWVWR